MEIAQLQYISDGDLTAIESYLKGGGRWVQLRMKGCSEQEIINKGIAVRELCHSYGATYILNDSAALAHRTGADGVHMGKTDGTTAAAREVLGRDKIIGRTAHTLADIEEISTSDADYIGLGALRVTATKSNIAGVLGYDGYRRIFMAFPRHAPPIVAIGGVVVEDIPVLMQIGLHGIAVSGLISKSEDIVEMTKNILRELQDARIKIL